MPMPSKERPAGFAAYAKQFGRKASRAHFQIGQETYDRWCKECGITLRRVQATLHPPEGFANHASVSNNDELMKRYGVGKATVIRWRKEVKVPGIRRVDTKLQMPENFRSAARGLTRIQLAERFGVCETVIRRWCKEADIPPQVGRPSKVFSGYVLNPPSKVQDNRPDSLVTRAQSHLQRIGPVWKKDASRFYVHGRVLSVDEMIERAVQAGFDPDNWRRLHI